jgi:hypothetical protein
MLLLSACAGMNYWYHFEVEDIKSVTVRETNVDPAVEVVMKKTKFEVAFDELKTFDYKSYTGNPKSTSTSEIVIVLNNDDTYIFTAYYIVKNGKTLKYSCNEEKYTEFILMWCG